MEPFTLWAETVELATAGTAVLLPPAPPLTLVETVSLGIPEDVYVSILKTVLNMCLKIRVGVCTGGVEGAVDGGASAGSAAVLAVGRWPAGGRTHQGEAGGRRPSSVFGTVVAVVVGVVVGLGLGLGLVGVVVVVVLQLQH